MLPYKPSNPRLNSGYEKINPSQDHPYQILPYEPPDPRLDSGHEKIKSLRASPYQMLPRDSASVVPLTESLE